MSVVGLRYFNDYGPRQDPNGPYAAVIPRWIGRLMTGERCQIFGDGSTSRDFTFVGDVVAANLAAATGPATDGVYNIAFGGNTDLNELYRHIREQVARVTGDDRTAALEPIYEPFRVGDVRRSLGDTSRARSAFGFDPRTALADGLARNVGWFWERSRSGRPD
jgi:UDP-N-acetylglucosamine 4-epimerase